MNPFGMEQPTARQETREKSGVFSLDLESKYRRRRSELKPEVRQYADKLHAKIKDMCTKFGSAKLSALYEKAASGEIKFSKKDSEDVSRLVAALSSALDKDELPEGHRELPPYEAFKNMVEHVNKLADPLKVTGLDDWEEYEIINGKLNGRVKVGDVKPIWFPLINGEPVWGFEGRGIAECGCIRNVGGRLNGKIRLDGGRLLPVINGKQVDSVDGYAIEACADVRNIDGKLNGFVSVDGLWLPVIGNKLILSIEDRDIQDCSNIRIIDGELNGGVQFNGEEIQLPVINGELIREIAGKRIASCNEVRNIDGKLNGEVMIGDRWLPVIDGMLIEKISGLEIEDCGDVRNVGGKLNGKFRLGGRWLPVIGGELISILGHENEGCDNIRNIGGKLNGMLVANGRRLPVIEGEVIENLGGKIVDCSEARNVGGKLNGKIKVELPNGSVQEYFVVLGEIVR